MRKAKDVNGERLFDSTEFLSAQQVASFFSRLAAKKTTDEDTEDDDEDEDHTAHLQRENHLQEMRDNLVTSMSMQNAHPIVYNSFNISELVQKSKLALFSIKMLQEICSSFGLDISNIKIKRKQPYINILRGLQMSTWHRKMTVDFFSDEASLFQVSEIFVPALGVRQENFITCLFDLFSQVIGVNSVCFNLRSDI